MKKSILIMATVSLLSTSAFSRDMNQVSVQVFGTVSWAALSVFAPAAAGALLVSISSAVGFISTTADETLRKQVQEIVNNDAQHFYNDGSISPALESSIKILKESDAFLSDADAVDALVEAVNQ